MIIRGTGNIKRRHAKNFIQDEADKRLGEVVRPYQQQGLNALGVDSFEVKYYHTCQSTQVCTCKQTDIVPALSKKNQPALVTVSGPKDPDAEIIIDYSRPLFGTVNDNKFSGDDTNENDNDLDEFAIIDEDDPPKVNNLFSTTNNCSICFKSGFVPGYELYGYTRQVLTTYDVDSVYGYTLDRASAPHTFLKQDPTDGFVDFVLEVPKYFKAASFVSRNNSKILDEPLLCNGQPLTLAALKSAAGGSCLIRCTAEEVTHIVVEFDLGTEKVRANLAQSSKTTDWTRFDTLGNISIIVPMLIAEVSTGDVIHVPTKNTSFKVTDFNYLRVAAGSNLDWLVNTRVLQPQEALRSLHKVFPVR